MVFEFVSFDVSEFVRFEVSLALVLLVLLSVLVVVCVFVVEAVRLPASHVASLEPAAFFTSAREKAMAYT